MKPKQCFSHNLRLLITPLILTSAIIFYGSTASAQPYGAPDRGAPGDPMIQQYLRQEAEKIESAFLESYKSSDDWNRSRPRFRQEYFDMLGLWPLPEKTPLNPTITRTLDRGDYCVDMLHYQSRPGLYVTGNLYRPAKPASGERFPAIFYVCGHSPRGRNGNKTAYQSHGIWFARHGYVCLVVDTLEMGEITCTHHGTYREGRWWWLSRGFTPAGVECWNGIRGIDYLVSRPDVDPEKIGVTGISGGGAATFWIAAGDERVKAAVPVSGLSDLVSHVPNRVVNGHCDCMFHYNTYQWPWARIAGMIAPRPLLFANSDQDSIFPMDGNERIILRLERLYSLFGAGDLVDSLVSVGGHAYRKDIRQSAYRFMNIHLKGDPRPVMDSEIDLVSSAPQEFHPIPPEQLRVFPQDSDFPLDARNRFIDQEFVPMFNSEMPKSNQFTLWKQERLSKLRELTFHHFPEQIPPAIAVGTNDNGIVHLKTEGSIVVRLKPAKRPKSDVRRVLVVVVKTSLDDSLPTWPNDFISDNDAVFLCEPRGMGASRWTTKNPPNYVERSHYLVGRTVDSGRIWDLAAVAKYIRSMHGDSKPLYLLGEGSSGVLCIYSALLESSVNGLMLSALPETHMDNQSPALLNVLRVCDIAEAAGMLAPRSISLYGTPPKWSQKVSEIYQSAGASEKYGVFK